MREEHQTHRKKTRKAKKRDLSAFCVPSGTSYRKARKSRSNRIKVAFSGFLLPFGGKRNAASKEQTTKKALQWYLLRLQAQKRVICDLRTKNKVPLQLPTNAAKVAQTERKRPFWRCFAIAKPQQKQSTTTKAPNFGQICDLSHFKG